MSYNLKCCSFYPNNFDASALQNLNEKPSLCSTIIVSLFTQRIKWRKEVQKHS